MSDDAPEFCQASQADPPLPEISRGLFNCPAHFLMLRRRSAVCIDKNVAIDCDHRFLRNHSCMATRSERSRSAGSPPFTVTQRIFFGLPRFLPRGTRN